MEQEKRRENIIAGLVGAFLGSLLGVVCIVVLGQLGYVASLSGVVMGVCTLKGYETLGGRLTKKGAVIAVLIILVMTYCANRLDWAISVADVLEIGIVKAFQSIDRLIRFGSIAGGTYWRGLAMLYVFTMVGAVPTIIQGLRGGLPSQFVPPPESAVRADGEYSAQDLEVYAPEPRFSRRLLGSILLTMIIPVLVSLPLLVISVAHDDDLRLMLAAIGALLSVIVCIIAAVPLSGLGAAGRHILVRGADKTFWQVQLMPLNMMEAYRFSKKTGALRAFTWQNLTPEEQRLAKESIFRAMEDIRSGRIFSGSTLNHIVTALNGLSITQDDRWTWKGSYQRGDLSKKVTIPKVFPGLRLSSETEAAEEPMPFKWSMCAFALICTLGMTAIGWFAGTLL